MGNDVLVLFYKILKRYKDISLYVLLVCFSLQVPNNATLALLPRQASLYNLSLLSERSERSTFSLPKQSPTLARPFGTNSSSQCKGLLSS